MSISAVSLSVLEFSSNESNSVHSLQFSSLLLSRRLCIFHLPTRKSKSFGDDVADAVIFKSPFPSKLNLGIGKLGSAVRTAVWARAKLQMARNKIVIKYFIRLIGFTRYCRSDFSIALRRRESRTGD